MHCSVRITIIHYGNAWKASRKHYISTKYAEGMNTSDKLYAEAVVNQSRICPKLNKAQSEVRTFMDYGIMRMNMCNGCMIVLSSTILLILHTHQMDGHCSFLSYASEYGEGTML